MNEKKFDKFANDIFKIVAVVVVGMAMFMLPVIAYLFRREYDFYSSSAVVFIWVFLFVFVFFDWSKSHQKRTP